jgi:membrane associated rhomboid family serine protease
MKIKYNAPVVLTFTLISTVVMAIGQLFPGFIYSFFALPGYPGFSIIFSLDVYKLFTHVAGHADWTHLLGNFTFILLIGPIIEEKYGSGNLFFMIMATALLTGLAHLLVNLIFQDQVGLLGASGVVFMMIILISFTNIKAGEIPLTLIFVILLFLIKEIIDMFKPDSVSQLAHIIGGMCGGFFGFLFHKKLLIEDDTA